MISAKGAKAKIDIEMRRIRKGGELRMGKIVGMIGECVKVMVGMEERIEELEAKVKKLEANPEIEPGDNDGE